MKFFISLLVLITPFTLTGQFVTRAGSLEMSDGNFCGKLIRDTLFSADGRIIGIGTVAAYRDGSPSPYQVGWWEEFDVSGNLRGRGEYRLSQMPYCGASGPFRKPYVYRFGQWTYWYANGTVMATGYYSIRVCKVSNNCGGIGIFCPYIGKGWTFADSTGQRMRLTRQLRRELEAVCY